MTAIGIAEKEGRTIDAIRKRWNTSFPGISFDASAELSPEMITAISKEKAVSAEKSERGNGGMKLSNSPVVSKGVPPGKFKFSVLVARNAAIDLLLFSIVAGHALLIWYDCATLWGMPGLIGGCISFLIVLAALLFSTDENKPRTSGTALWFVFMVDCGAFWVHYPTFQRAATIGNNETIALCIFLCGMSFAALYLFRDSKLG